MQTSIKDYVFDPSYYMKLLAQYLQFDIVRSDSHLIGQLLIDEQKYDVLLNQYEELYSFAKVTNNLAYGNIINFEFVDNQIVLTAALGIVIDGVVDPQYFGELKANVSYTSEQFELNNFQFTPNE